MKHTLAILIATLGFNAAQSALAANAAPLGLELGVASLDQVQARLSATRLTPTGINAWSDGPMFESDGAGLDIDGLRRITFIFDKGNRLAGVVMTMADHRFDEVFQHLAGKYRLQSKQIPFVGDRYARFSQDASIVEIEDPHLSFEMEVRYLTNDLVKTFRQRRAAQEAQRKQTQGAKF